MIAQIQPASIVECARLLRKISSSMMREVWHGGPDAERLNRLENWAMGIREIAAHLQTLASGDEEETNAG